MKLDVLVFSAHPDDAELGVGGTVIKLVQQGKKVGLIDLTRGELGTRGSAEIRDKEAQDAGEIMGVHIRENLAFRDGFFVIDEAHKLAIIQKIRQYQPEIVITGAPEDRHPDHGRGSKLVREAAFLSGLRKIETVLNGEPQKEWRPKRLFFYIQDWSHTPDFVVDITPFVETKKAAILAYSSQFFDPKYQAQTGEPETYISNENFWHFQEGRWRNMGHMTGVVFGEGFLSEIPLQVDTPMDLI
ncbi:MAG: bacillithiol biosynthesis deacetylase BshB1 [Bacteroidota bacterium]